MNDDIEYWTYLDRIVSYLKNSPNSTARYEDVLKDIIEYLDALNKSKGIFHTGPILTQEDGKAIEEDGFTPVDFSNTSEYRKQMFYEAILYLIEIQIVRETRPEYVLEFNPISLTFKGQIKAVKGFVDEYEKSKKEKSMRLNLPRWQIGGIIGAIVFGFSGVAVGIYANIHKNDSSCKYCIYRQQHPSEIHDQKQDNKKTREVIPFSKKVSHDSMENKNGTTKNDNPVRSL